MGLFTQALLVLLATPFFSCPVSAQDQYDYIVVGSGPGGGPLASNLARANYSVLLIEAGDQSTQGNSGQYPPQITWDFFVKHYADEKRNMMNNKLVWKTTQGRYWVGPGSSTPPSGAKFLGVYYPRGSTVGGSSMINAMCTWLPADSDWNYIANITGDSSWSADKMRKLFERIEKNNYVPRGTPGHGFDGYFQTNMNKPTSIGQPVLGIIQAIAANFSVATDASSITKMMSSDANFLDPKRDFMNGIWGLPTHTKANGERYSSRDYIQETIKANFPLTLSMNSLATRVLFSPDKSCGGQPRATGIEYLQGKSLYKADARWTASNKGVLKTATARKEVILSGGTFNTPQLLLLSGIGPAAQLQKFNIPLLVDSPGVGNNMQDNQEMPIIGQVSGQTSGGFSQPIIMMTTTHTPDGERDMFVMQGSFAFRGFWPSNQTNTALPQDGPGTYGISMVKGKPQNRAGYVRLASADPTDMPEINFMLYEQGRETDMGAMKSTIAWARNMYAAARGIKVAAKEPPCPQGPDANGGCGAADEEWIIGQTFGHHPTSTAAIGAEGDKNAVLDARFRVRGVKGLRVVDASVYPRIPGVFPVVSTFMVSEKASDTIKEDAARDVCAA
ncbi:GMC oxidoreductase-like protein [Westerdykella ornata]|uniref:GMC oxidoreductase-like protein n=1 Tax=Westerdykella ornata TaxID=318751 RepID=A0A6A6JM74_WESOR|nr:GMC oxidoreductase-like protein [Westerdykella ornata]KAF2277048.1 GMC oxidoreductase-like protein [Westerdykella ornata]